MGVKERWGKSSPIKFTTDKAVSLILPLLNNNPNILVAHLFGSRIKKDDQSPDIDISFYTSDDFSWEDYYILYGEISKALCSDRIDLIWLNKSDPIFKFEVIKNGKVLFYKDADVLNDFESKSKKNYYDYVLYIKKHRRNRELVYRKESLLKRIEKLREYRHDLKQMSDISFEEYVKDRKIKYSIERVLFLISENILDFLDHILSSRFEIISESYEDIIDNAYKKDLIDASLYSKLKGLGGFRNILAHEYLSISDEEVFRNLKKMVKMIDSLIEAFENIVK